MDGLQRALGENSRAALDAGQTFVLAVANQSRKRPGSVSSVAIVAAVDEACARSDASPTVHDFTGTPIGDADIEKLSHPLMRRVHVLMLLRRSAKPL